MKYSSINEMGPESHKKWKDFASKFNPEDLYIGGVCGLYYNLNVFEFLNKQEPTDFLSVLFVSNSIGSDKQPLLIIGNQAIPDDKIQSLPCNYIPTNSAQFNKTIIENYLNKLDDDFKAKNKVVTLILNFPQRFLDDLKLTNINLVAAEHIPIVIAKTDMLAKYVKSSYRKLQILKSLQKTQKNFNFSFIEYMYLISMSWNNVQYDYIRKLFYYNEGFSEVIENKDLSLSVWCKKTKMPINCEQNDFLDEFINCDNKIRVFNLTNTDLGVETKFLSQNTVSVTGVEAYQAMKRLVSYLQSKHADAAIISTSRFLENHLECGALLEMHDSVKSENNT